MRLIDADALKEKAHMIEIFDKQWVVDEIEIENAPTIDPVKRGEWLTDRFGMERSICSECRKVFETGGNYCPSCGARMDGDCK